MPRLARPLMPEVDQSAQFRSGVGIVAIAAGSALASIVELHLEGGPVPWPALRRCRRCAQLSPGQDHRYDTDQGDDNQANRPRVRQVRSETAPRRARERSRQQQSQPHSRHSTTARRSPRGRRQSAARSRDAHPARPQRPGPRTAPAEEPRPPSHSMPTRGGPGHRRSGTATSRQTSPVPRTRPPVPAPPSRPAAARPVEPTSSVHHRHHADPSAGPPCMHRRPVPCSAHKSSARQEPNREVSSRSDRTYAF